MELYFRLWLETLFDAFLFHANVLCNFKLFFADCMILHVLRSSPSRIKSDHLQGFRTDSLYHAQVSKEDTAFGLGWENYRIGSYK